jgi:hypothetical protein
LTFPFTVTSGDFESVVGFLYEHFLNCQDSSLGTFMTWETRLEPGDRVSLASQMALSPYDLGVTQSLFLISRASEIEGIEEIHVEIRRVSGQPNNWWRLNKRLVRDLRRQMLLWRSLPEGRINDYRKVTQSSLSEAGKGVTT